MKEETRPTNEKGQEHGYWEIYLENGGVYYKGYYDMGEKVDYEVFITTTATSEMFPIY